jgi:ATP-dependent helicase/nuclease subunit A
MPKWTVEQQAAIDARDCNLLVAAAAGSGKTAVLVERILQLILKDEAELDRLLVVTFTNAAAGEMRERIGAALMKALDENRGDSRHLRRQMNLLPKASISTLHAFCIRIIRQYFHVINLDPGFRIGDDTECSLIRLDAIDDLFEKEYEKGSEKFYGLVERFGNNRQDTPLQDLVLRLHGFIQSKPDPERWMEVRVQDFALKEEEIGASPWYQALLSQIRMDLAGAMDLLQDALALCRKPGGPMAYEANLLDDLSQLEDLLSLTQHRGLRACCQAYPGIKFKNLKRCGRDVEDSLKEAVQEQRNQAKAIFKNLGDGFLSVGLEHSVEQLNELYPYMQYLCDLVFKFDREYRRQKQERGIIDFNDLEHYALDILKNEEVAEELRSKYSYIFVDEYQDSNLVQETIVNKIAREDNLFLVGDVKQSIYRFRLADPSVFLSRYRASLPEEGTKNRRIDLNRNFRSRPSILNAVNYLFRNIMSAQFGEMDYDGNAALYPGLNTEDLPDPETELHLVEKAEAGKEDPDPDTESLSDIEVEAGIAAQRVQSLVGTELPVPGEKGGQGVRTVDYRDIVVLMRSTVGWAAVFQEVFAAAGIPVYADVNTGYFEALEVKTVIALLKVVDNKCQDIPLLTVLRSPIGGFCADDLIRIRTVSHGRFFWQAATEYAANREDRLSRRLRDFYGNIAQWQMASRYLSMEDFIWKLYTESGYYSYVGAMPGGEQRQANLRILLDRAHQFQQTSIKGLFRFIRFIDKLQNSSGDMGAARILGENENVVRIMSIHKSKGLEFPVVIAAGLGKQFNRMDTNADVLFHKDLGLGPKYVNPETRQTCDTIARSAMKQVIRMESLSEEMRILYVAFTRPKDKLILLGSVRDLGKAAGNWAKSFTPYSLSRGKCFLDWICPPLIRHPDGSPLRELAGAAETEESLAEDPSVWKVELHDRGEVIGLAREGAQNKKAMLYRLENPEEYLKSLEEEKDSKPAEKDTRKDLGKKDATQTDQKDLGDQEKDLLEESRKTVNDRFSWIYPYRCSITVPSKLSVTEIKNMLGLRGAELPGKEDTVVKVLSDPMPSLIDHPGFLESSRKFTGAERGTIVHFVLQHLDLSQVDNEEKIRRQISGMVEKELLTQEEAEAVDVGILDSFFCSRTGLRIRNAKGVRREVPFNLRKKASEVMEGMETGDDNLLIQGIMDCVFEENGRWILVDYKTDYVDPRGGVRKLVDRYRVQIDYYTEALEKITGKPVGERILCLLSINQAVSL